MSRPYHLHTDIMMNYLVTASHRSEYPNPLVLQNGDRVTIGELYQGPENWDHWIYCSTNEHSGGWVPEQIIERLPETTTGRVIQDYSALEMDVDEGDLVHVNRQLNGWCWCVRPKDGAQGWVPVSHLSPQPTSP